MKNNIVRVSRDLNLTHTLSPPSIVPSTVPRFFAGDATLSPGTLHFPSFPLQHLYWIILLSPYFPFEDLKLNPTLSDSGIFLICPSGIGSLSMLVNRFLFNFLSSDFCVDLFDVFSSLMGATSNFAFVVFGWWGFLQLNCLEVCDWNQKLDC